MKMNVDNLFIVNYCHRNCIPLQNIMRLPKEQAFALAYKMADQNKETTAFYRFADFENYYYERLNTDKLLYESFKSLGGKPVVKHPLSFVLQGSVFLNNWFDEGIITKIPLSMIPAEHISFTYGDSMSTLRKCGGLTMLTKEMLMQVISEHNGTLEEFIDEINSRYHYMEVQIWDDTEILKYMAMSSKEKQ